MLHLRSLTKSGTIWSGGSDQIQIMWNTETQFKATFYRVLTQTQETFKNSPNCGKPLESNSRKVIRQLEEDECLSGCTWKVNPLFKVQPKGPFSHYAAKWYEEFFTPENTFPQLYDAPMVPKDLTCLKGCFDKFSGKTLSKIQEKCSLIGLDRQIPTHTKEGFTLVQSSFTDLVNGRPPFFVSAPLPSNPNLDCLVYHETKERKECRSKGGVCNFIPDQGGRPNDMRRRRGYTQRQNEVIETDITISPNYLLRASTPVTRAIEVCALAKVIQFHKVGEIKESSFTTPEAVNLFSGDSPSTCDHFMPDIFGSLCSCVGTCAPPNYDPTSDTNPNLILDFETDKGLWGCQNECKQTENCEFYTHYSVHSFFKEQDKYIQDPPVFYCSLWKKCDKFVVPVESGWLDIRSGPKDCALYTQKCPIVSENNILTDLPPGYTAIPCSKTPAETCSIEVKYLWYSIIRGTVLH